MKIPFQKLLVIIGIAALAVPFLEVSVTNQVRDSFDDFTNVIKGFIVVFMGVIACGAMLLVLQVILSIINRSPCKITTFFVVRFPLWRQKH